MDELLYIPKPCDKLYRARDYERAAVLDQQSIRRSLTWAV
jgi:hypothetical protein